MIPVEKPARQEVHWGSTKKANTEHNTFQVQIWIEETQVSLGYVLDIFTYILWYLVSANTVQIRILIEIFIYCIEWVMEPWEVMVLCDLREWWFGNVMQRTQVAHQGDPAENKVRHRWCKEARLPTKVRWKELFNGIPPKRENMSIGQGLTQYRALYWNTARWTRALLDSFSVRGQKEGTTQYI